MTELTGASKALLAEMSSDQCSPPCLNFIQATWEPRYFTDRLIGIEDAVKEEVFERIKAEPFFPEGDGPTHGNAAAFRNYKRRVLELVWFNA